MRADDERDPLDSWLNQQVKPLPPPPGTFELITRRARGRKLRKLAVTVVSAAAVAAAVAIAVPIGLNLHLNQTPVNGNFALGSTADTHREAVVQRERVPRQVVEPVPLRDPFGDRVIWSRAQELSAILGHVRQPQRRLGDRASGHPGHVRQQKP